MVRKLAKKLSVNNKDLRRYSHYLVWGAVAAVGLSALDFLGISFWLTATQWLVVAGVLATFGIYTKMGA